MLRLDVYLLFLTIFIGLVNGEKVISCYYRYSQPPISSLDLTLCTHIILIGEATIDSDGLFVPPSEEYILEFIRIKQLNEKIKLMISLIAPNRHFSAAVSSPSVMQNFTDTTYQYLLDYRLDGIDLDWEFPTWSRDAKKTDKQRLSNLLKVLREKYGNKYLLSMAVSGPPTITRVAYDVPMLNKYCDFVQVMNYDFHVFSWLNPVTGFNAPLRKFKREYGIVGEMNSEASMWVYGALGLHRNKTVFGIPVYNLAFRLVNYYWNWPYAPSVGEINGFGGYASVCNLTNYRHPVYKKYWSDAAASPYITGTDKTWITSEDPRSVREKAAYAREIDCLGIMVFHLGTDDVYGECEEGTFPLIRSAKKSFLSQKKGDLIE